MKHTDTSSKDFDTLTVAIVEMELVVQLVNKETQASGDKDRLISFLNKIEGIPVIFRHFVIF